MNNVGELLNEVEGIAKSHLSGNSLVEIKEKIKRCRSKINDDKLYLAIVGEFSSGKSTFINALLGFRLLKEAVMPTTACATYIKSEGNVLVIDVRFFDGNRFKATAGDFQDVASYIESKYGRVRNSLQEIIEDVTSDQIIARTVEELHISVPGANIPENIVLIDTPGFNPGAASVDNHYEITKHIVENVADAALILTPQEQVMSATLLRFLADNLYRCLHRCYFVVTKMDYAEARYKSEIIDFALQRIQNDLNISQPKLYAESAITMLPVKKIPAEKIEEWEFYRHLFKQFEKEVWEDLRRKKAIVLKEHIDTLMMQIVRLCSQKIQKRELSVKEDRAFLSAHKLETIQNVCNEMINQSADAINNVLYGVNVSFNIAETNCHKKAEEIINEGLMTKDRFIGKVLPSIQSLVEEEAKQHLNKISTTLNKKIKRCVDEQVIKMQRVFASHYDSFPALRPKNTTIKTNLIKFNNPNMSFSIAVSKIRELDKKEDNAAKAGAGGGAGIGFLLGGPVGAVIGAIVGSVAGSVAGSQSEQMKASAKPLVKKEISSFFSSLLDKVNNEKNSIKSRYYQLVKKFTEDHINSYGDAVENLIENRKRQIRLLDKQIKMLKISLNTLNDLHDNLEEELAVLRLKN